MRHLDEIRDEEALDVLAELFEPASEIFSNKEVIEAFREKKPAKAVMPAIKNNKKAVFKLLAILDGVPVEEYHCGIFELPLKLLEVMKDKYVLDFFSSQGQMLAETYSGSATESSEEKEG